MPLAEGYGEDFDLSDPAMGMARVPRVGSYRGFVFASLSPDGPDLKTHLGQATLAFDELNDLAPDGEVELAAGVHRYTIRGNWKFQAENNCDMYHAPYAHASSLGRDNRQFQRFEGDRGVSFSDRDGSALPLWDEAGLWVTGLGHVIQGPLPRTGEANSPADTRYRAMLEEKHGLERARELMSPRRLATLIYPNVLIHSWNRHVRVFVPQSVDRTEVRVYPIHLKGIPEELFQREIRHLNVTHAAASFIQPDDVETFGRQQVGLTADSADWVRFTRGSGADLVDSEMGWRTLVPTRLACATNMRRGGVICAPRRESPGTPEYLRPTETPYLSGGPRKSSVRAAMAIGIEPSVAVFSRIAGLI